MAARPPLFRQVPVLAWAGLIDVKPRDLSVAARRPGQLAVRGALDGSWSPSQARQDRQVVPVSAARGSTGGAGYAAGLTARMMAECMPGAAS